MSFKIKLLPAARRDVKEIIDWYNSQKAGLGKKFYQSLKMRLTNIKKNPKHYQVSYRGTRNTLINRFPYQVHYWIEETPKLIIVFGVTHTSRNPNIWKNRK